MEKEAKFKIGDFVYFIDKKEGIMGGRIKASFLKHESFYDECIKYEIRGYNQEFKENELFTNRRNAFRKLLDWVDVEKDKVEYVCQYLFPDEVTEDDFNTVAPEPLQIPEKTGFFKNLFK